MHNNLNGTPANHAWRKASTCISIYLNNIYSIYQKKVVISYSVSSIFNMVNWVLNLVHRWNRCSFDELQAICNSFCIERIWPTIRSHPTINLALDLFLPHQTSPAAVAVDSFEATFSAKHFLQQLKSLTIWQSQLIKEPYKEVEPLI